jgi:CO/xanthine dehydrogenase FAD-binding subunit
MDNFYYYKPHSLERLWKLMAEVDGEAVLLSGGTDLFPQMKSGLRSIHCMIDLKEISELQYLKLADGYLHIGANITLSSLLEEDSLPKSLTMLTSAVMRIGSPQIRNKATLAGNICNASPAADSVPPLICMGAKVKVQDGIRSDYLDLDNFLKGPGQTTLKRGEVITEVLVPIPSNRTKGTFIKLSRLSKDLATVNIAVLIELASDGETCKDAKIVLGAVGPKALRLKNCEDLFIGNKISDLPLDSACELAMKSSEPIDDIEETIKSFGSMSHL